MYTGAALSFGLMRACRGGLVLYCSVLSDAGGENDRNSAIFERSLLYKQGVFWCVLSWFNNSWGYPFLLSFYRYQYQWRKTEEEITFHYLIRYELLPRQN